MNKFVQSTLIMPRLVSSEIFSRDYSIGYPPDSIKMTCLKHAQTKFHCTKKLNEKICISLHKF